MAAKSGGDIRATGKRIRNVITGLEQRLMNGAACLLADDLAVKLDEQDIDRLCAEEARRSGNDFAFRAFAIDLDRFDVRSSKLHPQIVERDRLYALRFAANLPMSQETAGAGVRTGPQEQIFCTGARLKTNLMKLDVRHAIEPCVQKQSGLQARLRLDGDDSRTSASRNHREVALTRTEIDEKVSRQE